MALSPQWYMMHWLQGIIEDNNLLVTSLIYDAGQNDQLNHYDLPNIVQVLLMPLRQLGPVQAWAKNNWSVWYWDISKKVWLERVCLTDIVIFCLTWHWLLESLEARWIPQTLPEKLEQKETGLLFLILGDISPLTQKASSVIPDWWRV